MKFSRTRFVVASLTLLSMIADSPAEEGRKYFDPYEDEQSVSIGQIPLRIISMGLDGSVDTLPYSIGAVKYPARTTIEFLQNENVQRELEITDAQANRIAELDKRAESLVSSAVKEKFEAGGVRDETRQALMNLPDDIEEILLPHQLKRLDELKFRCTVRREGWPIVLIRTPFGKNALKLSNDQQRTLRVAAPQIAKEFEPQITKMSDVAWKRFRDCFSEEQQQSLRAFLGEDYFQGRIPLDILLFQMRDSSQSKTTTKHEPAASTADDVKAYEGFLEQAGFRIAPDGSICQGPHVKSINLNLLRTLNDPLIAELVDLSAEQMQMVKTILADFDEQIIALSPSSELLNNKEELKEFMNRTNGKKRLIYERIPGEIERILVPYQLKRFQTLGRLIGIRRTGLYQAVVSGDLDKELKITEAQKTKLKQTAEQIRRDYLKDSIRIEKEIDDKVLQLLTDEQRNLIEERLGAPIKKMPANVGTMILLLQQTEY